MGREAQSILCHYLNIRELSTSDILQTVTRTLQKIKYFSLCPPSICQGWGQGNSAEAKKKKKQQLCTLNLMLT